MAHPVVFWPTPFFYAVGNTPAVSLTANLPIEDDAKVLLLGCGDPRSILFTTFADGPDAKRSLDFTCCDIDVAVLARNTILLTLLADDTPHKHIWSIFYDLYLDGSTISLLTAHCNTLLKISESVEQWHAERYGFIRMCSRSTLLDLRKLWKLYAEVDRFSEKQKSRFRACFDRGKEKTRATFHAGKDFASLRSAGPLFLKASGSKSFVRLFDRYWTTGLTGTISNSGMLPNPTFAYSRRGEEFALHYGTNPYSGFHLAQHLSATKDNSMISVPNVNKENYDPVYVDSIQQFSQWCAAFQKKLALKDSSTKLTIRLFAGEVLAFCKTLEIFIKSRESNAAMYAAPWKLAPLVLDGGDYDISASNNAPCRFNVIDTSNLVDHLGLLNILVCSSPLLLQEPSSCLFTETLVTGGEDPTAYVKERLCGDISLMSMLIGLAPSSYLSRFTTTSNLHEVLEINMRNPSMGDHRQFHERLAWAMPYSNEVTGDIGHLSGDPENLAKVFFQIYQKMFWNESPGAMFANINISSFREASIPHFTRASLARLMATVQKRIVMDWDRCLHLFLMMVQYDRQLLMGMNNYQDLLLHLHLEGVLPTALHTQGGKEPLKDLHPKIGRLNDWKDIPQVVSITMVVSRKELDPLQESGIGSPILQVEMYAGGGHNIFTDFHPCFGSIINANEDGVEIEEDPLGWKGKSTLLVSCLVPSALLLIAPSQTTLNLAVKSTPSTATLAEKLGMMLHLFEASLSDQSLVKVSKRLPGISKRPAESAGALKADPKVPGQRNKSFFINPGVLDFNAAGTQISSFSKKVDILDPTIQSELRGGSVISTKQTVPTAITIAMGSTRILVPFEYPVNQAAVKVRIARKSSYIEVIAPISDHLHTAASPSYSIPLAIHQGLPRVFNIHYLNLCALPRLQRNPNNLDWMRQHMLFTFTALERSIRESKVTPLSLNDGFLCDVKDTIATLMMLACGLDSGKIESIFGLSDPEAGGVYALIFVTDVCLDLSAHSVVLDTCILPLTVDLVLRLETFLGSIVKLGHRVIKTNATEREAWMRLLPAFTERCRTWSHKKSCEYTKVGIPASMEYGKSPLCSCALGNPSPEFVKDPRLSVVAPYVTRAAISPLYAVASLDRIIDKHGLDEMLREVMGKRAGCRKCGKTEEEKGSKLLNCGRCRNVKYCSANCQKADWKEHKALCRKL